ncbi:rhodanese-like domain-containing protein [Paenalkalicoccus suaedae]|uniref:Rhodanese-like domain-containing protein n=1 Tax=Paenalkalicoccus suaedae TaxID=2592382 RepID=A0A859FAY4_9BACI|nr:rhodanese-like domain-containing protein [Paenalkalicoccus suaedae]QKS70513.1 rhodanese-like domain-containing protein [Paenalkalicoccus suaedae]
MKTIMPKNVLDHKDAVILDVREVEEVQAGRIEGSTHIPLGLLEFRLHELDKLKPHIVVCRSGARSGRATAYLTEQGFDATNMVGGMNEWQGTTV